jgi:hypothetical protein
LDRSSWIQKNSDSSLQKSVKGMNIEIMHEWCDWAKCYIPKGSVLLMDRLSSHINKQILDELKKNGITVLLLPPKGSLLLSPLNNGFFVIFKRRLSQEMGLHPVSFGSPHLNAAIRAYNSIPRNAVLEFFKNCGLIGTDSLSTIKKNFQKQTQMLMKKENMECLEIFQKWAVGDLKIDGVKPPRFYQEEPPNLYNENELDGVYWCTWGQQK